MTAHRGSPKLPAQSPELIEHEALATKIADATKAVKGEIQRLEQATSSTSHDDESVREAAQQLLAGEVEVDRCWTPPLEKIEELRGRLRVLEAASEQLAPLLAQDRERHALAVAAKLKPCHKEVAARIAAALTELMEANEAEEEIRSRVPGRHLQPMCLNGLGRFGDGTGLGHRWRAYAKSAGYWPEGLDR